MPRLVFPARLDLGSRNGDVKGRRGVGSHTRDQKSGGASNNEAVVAAPVNLNKCNANTNSSNGKAGVSDIAVPPPPPHPLQNSTCDSGLQCAPQHAGGKGKGKSSSSSSIAKSMPTPPHTQNTEPTPQKLSYSVKFLNWSVSDCSSDEEECRNVTLSLNRLKIRKSSKERRGAIRNSATKLN